MSKFRRGKYLVNLVTGDANEEKRTTSPLTEEQKKFLLENENNNDFWQFYSNLEQNSPAPDQEMRPETPELRLDSFAPITENQENLLLELDNVPLLSPDQPVGSTDNISNEQVLVEHESTQQISSNQASKPDSVSNDIGLPEAQLNEIIRDSLGSSQNSLEIFNDNHYVIDTPADLYASDNHDSDSDWVPESKRRKTSRASLLINEQPLLNIIEDTTDSSTSVIEPTSDDSVCSKKHKTRSGHNVVIESSSLSETAENSSSSEEVANSSIKKSKKRVRKIGKWKREIAKKRRLQGKRYVSAVSKDNKVKEKKEMKLPCSETCKLKCRSKISNETRSEIFHNFWKVMQNWDQRRQFIASSIDITPVARPRHRKSDEVSRRKNTRMYHLLINNERLHVCQKMFLNTLCVTEQFVSTTLLKTLDLTNVVQPDRRGKHEPINKTPDSVTQSIKDHISSFPQYTSHYSRDKTSRCYLGPELNIAKMYCLYEGKCKDENMSSELIGKEWLYRKNFNEEFNLSFYSPSKDTCDTCDKFILQLKQEKNPDERLKIEELQKAHLKDANNRYGLKKKDKENSKLSNGKSLTLMLDMQKCLPTPLLTNTQSFYLRKLWVLNETLHNDTTNKSYCMMWNEVLGGRGANEVGSCLLEWALNYLEPAVNEITIWSDNCSGQNRNIIMIYCYFWILCYTNLTTINHKLLLRGHTHSEVDMIHSVIERKKKELAQFEIMMPRDWEQFVKICKPTNPLIVHSMTLNNIKNIKSLSSLFSQRRKNSNNEAFLISKCVWFQVRKSELGVLFYKTSFEETDFLKIDLRRNTRQQFQLPDSLPQVNKHERPVSNPKYKDLMTLTQWMADTVIKKYYTDLPHGNVADIVESDNED